jgi:hypothetical protein
MWPGFLVGRQKSSASPVWNFPVLYTGKNWEDFAMAVSWSGMWWVNWR